MDQHPLLNDSTGMSQEEGDSYPTYYLQLGGIPDKDLHACGIKVYGMENKRDLVLDSVNAMIVAANELGCTPYILATSLVGRIAKIATALVHGRDALCIIRDVTGVEWPPYFWDEVDGEPGHALKLIIDCIEMFPVDLKGEPSEGEQLIRDMRDYINKAAAAGDESVQPLIDKANKMLGE